MRQKKRLAGCCSIVSALLLFACSSNSNGLVIQAEVEEVAQQNVPASISIDRLQKIEKVLQEDIKNEVRAGYSVMVAKDGKLAYSIDVGMADLENEIPLVETTRFRIASLTKAITNVAILQLVEEGDVLLSDPVSKYIPSFSNVKVATSYTKNADGGFDTEQVERPITIHHLLTHTEGFDYAFIPDTDLAMHYLANAPYKQEGSLAARVDKLAQLPLFNQPGEVYRYGYGTDVAGRVIEVVSKMDLESYLKARIFDPLNMENTEFFVDESDSERVALTYSTVEGQGLVPTQMDPFQPAPNGSGLGWMSAGGGLVSTTNDYIRFLMMLLNEGQLDGERIISEAGVGQMLRRQISDEVLKPEIYGTLDLPRKPGTTLGLGGYVIEDPGVYGEMSAEGQWGWEGYYDTSAFISPNDELAVVIMTQSSPWERLPSSVKGRVKAIVYSALESK